MVNGAVILDLSKYIMFNFFYNVLQYKYENKVKLLFTDTDSLCVSIETETDGDLYKELNDIKDHLDFSEYPKYHKSYDSSNCAIAGYFKDEFGAQIITEFIGLR